MIKASILSYLCDDLGTQYATTPSYTFQVMTIGLGCLLFLTAVSMAIINLLIKPFTSFVLFKIYQHRGGSYGDLNIPGVPNFAGVSHVQVVH